MAVGLEGLGLKGQRFYLLLSKMLIRYNIASINMERQSSIFCEDRDTTCYFCSPTTHQIKIVLKCTFRRLKLLNSKIKHRGRNNQGGSCVQASFAVQRLLKMLFEKQQFQLTLSRNCSHLPLINLFKGKLSCSLAELQKHIEDLCDSIARRNYELEVTTMQIKNVEESVGDLGNLPQELPEQGESDKQSVQMREQVQVKIEEEKRPTAVANEITTPSQPNHNNELVYPSAPPPYNILFFGNMFYP